MLVVYHRYTYPRFADAATINHHIGAIEQYSAHNVWSVNAELGFPRGLAELEFDAIVLHYSVFGMSSDNYMLDDEWWEYLSSTQAHLTAFFQDEYIRNGQRYRMLDAYEFDCVFTLLEPSQFAATYAGRTSVPTIVWSLAGYVSDDVVGAAQKFALPDAQRPVDVSYRGRPLFPYMGRGGLEKSQIATGFAAAAKGSGLVLDIDGSVGGRIYGDDWWRLLGRSKAALGVEAGVSVFDVDDVVFPEYLRRLDANPDLTVDDMTDVLAPHEDRILYRTISPRHFEAAAFGVCQVLFEGRYSGHMQPMVHYLPLRKDFSNADEVIAQLKDAALRGEIVANARRDLVDSGEFGYSRLAAQYDGVLADAGITPRRNPDDDAVVAAVMRRDRVRRRLEWTKRYAIKMPVEGVYNRTFARLRDLAATRRTR